MSSRQPTNENATTGDGRAPSTHARRRGTVYVVVIGVATTVSLIGMSGLMVARLQMRRAAEANAWTEAGDLALSGIELGITRVNAAANWRTSFQNNVEITPIAIGGGTVSFKLVDAALGLAGGDGNLANNGFDPVRLYGIGRVGKTVRVYSAQLIGDVPLDALRTTVAASGYLTVKVPTVAKGGPLSANGLYSRNDTTTGAIEAGSISGTGVVYGTITAPSAAKAMPDPSVFDAYKRLATPIAWAGGSVFTLAGQELSSAVNPVAGGTLNAQGVYCVDVPAGGKLKITTSYIRATLVVDCGDGAIVQLMNAINWEPNSSDLPALLVRHSGAAVVKDKLGLSSGTISYNSVDYPSQIKGLVHIIGGSAAAQGSGNAECNLGDTASFVGTIIADQDAVTNSNSAMFCWDPNLYLNPPVGYSAGATMKIVTGSLRWEASP